MGARSKARRRALDLLFAADLRGESAVDALERAIGEGEAPSNEYTDVIVRGVVADRDRIDALLTEHAHDWTLDRMPVVDRNVLRIGTWELLEAASDVPTQVAISEAMLLVRDLSTDESPTFVNGVLSAIARSLRG